LTEVILGSQKLAPTERLQRAVPVLHMIASALQCGHAVTPKAVVHRDLKPANVLMAGDTPRVTDYGIGGLAAEFQTDGVKARTFTATIEQYGTIVRGAYSQMYASPQQRDGEKPDPRDDVHALGVLAYQMLVGRVDVR
jgi:serine/threonine protein kinase